MSKWTINKQVVMLSTRTGVKNNYPRVYSKGNKYTVKTLRKDPNGNMHYVFTDGGKIVLKSTKGVFKYTSGYVDPAHMTTQALADRKAEKAKKAEEAKKKKETGSTTSNDKATDDGETNEAGEEAEEVNEALAADLKEIGMSSFEKMLLASGDYVRMPEKGREVFKLDKDGNPIETTTDFTKFNEDIDSIHDSKYGGTITKLMQNLDGIHGVPYQFLQTADRRTDGFKIGRVYKQQIMDNVPLLLLTPGVPKFMDDFDDDTRDDILTAMGKKGSDVILDQLVGDEHGLYYTFKYKFAEYFDYVNTMLNAMANLLGIGDMEFRGKKLDTFKWQHFANKDTKGVFTSHQSIPFYIEAQSQVSEAFSNATGESQLADNVNTVSTYAKEIQFLIGGVGGAQFNKLITETLDKSLTGLSNTISSFEKIMPTRIMNKLMGGFGTLAVGGKIIFPEIWQDSNYSKSQDVTMKFTSPSGDPFSIYINVLVPLIHILAMVAPRSMGANGYQSPYIVRAWYKGSFSTDLGMIDNLSISRGDKGKWNKDGLPLQIEVSLSIKDLYGMISVSKRDGALKFDLVQNPLLLSYLSTLCGINSYKPDLLRTYDLYMTSVKNIPSDLINSIFDSTVENLTNLFNLENPKLLPTLTYAGYMSLINNFKPSKKAEIDEEQDKINPNLPDGFEGLARKDGETDEEYALRVYAALEDHNIKDVRKKYYESVIDSVGELNKEGAKYGLEPIDILTPEKFAEKTTNPTNDAYTEYISAKIDNYKHEIAWEKYLIDNSPENIDSTLEKEKKEKEEREKKEKEKPKK